MLLIVSAVTLLAVVAIPAVLLIQRMLRQARTAVALRMESAGGIVEERFVRIGGIDQWIGIRGEDQNNPVLILHGGPGCSYSIFTPHVRSWEKYFTIVQWDQRGGGKTFSRMGGRRTGEISFEQLTNDAIEVVDYVRAASQRPDLSFGEFDWLDLWNNGCSPPSGSLLCLYRHRPERWNEARKKRRISRSA